MNDVVFVIPAFNPGPPLLTLVNDLRSRFSNPIVVVDDGSSEDSKKFFNPVSATPNLSLLTHGLNMGKGAALKTALNYVLINKPNCRGALTIDADGQHSVGDVFKVLEASKFKQFEALILGIRDFKGNVPLRSQVGNKLTQFIFFLLLGKSLKDTQTGLRFIPRLFFPKLLTIQKNRYEFELEVLLHAVQNKWSLVQIPISTIYIENNASSHFNPLFDSIRIYFVFFRYVGLSLLTAFLDNIIFAVTLFFTEQISTLSGPRSIDTV